jgi:protease I
MKKNLIFIVIIIILLIVGVIFVYKNKNEKEITPKNNMPENTLSGKKLALIIAFRDFRDAEYFIPKEILEKAGAKITTVSNKKGTAVGADGGDVGVDLALEEVNPSEFDAVVFIGGPGCLQSLDDENSYKIIKETVEQDKVLGSICISPVILAKAGILAGKKATVWSSLLDKSAVKILKDNGAIYEDENVVVDGKLVTGNGPEAAEEFALKLVGVLVPH